MRLLVFLMGVLCGVALAPTSSRAAINQARNSLAKAIDAALRIGISAAPVRGEQAL